MIPSDDGLQHILFHKTYFQINNKLIIKFNKGNYRPLPSNHNIESKVEGQISSLSIT
jgi:hypothetical protein